MNENSIDFSLLDPTRDHERFERMVRSITTQAADFLVVRPLRRLGVMEQIAAWRRPMVAVASVVAAVSVLIFVRFGVGSGGLARAPQIAEAVGVPATVAQWLRSGQLPTAGDLLEAFGGGVGRGGQE